MAGPKLTADQKLALRSELASRVSAGDRVASIVPELALKYAVAANTIRWHLRKLDVAPRRRRRRSPGRGVQSELEHLIDRLHAASRESAAIGSEIRDLQLKLTRALFEAAPSPPSRAPLPSTYVPFGRRLRELRKQAGITLAAVSARVGTNKSYLSAMENGKVAPASPKVVRRIAEAFGVDAMDLLRSAEVEKLPEELRADAIRAFWPEKPGL